MLMPSIFGEDLFDDFMRDFPFNDRDMKRMERKLYGHHGKNMMKTDIKEMDNGYELEMDLPGFTKDEVKEKKTGKYIRRERYAGACQRTFYVGEDVAQEDIKAEFKHGILKLFIPKKEAKPAVEDKNYISIE